MKIRLRTLAALLALLAFSASFAEQAWASACASMAPAEASAPVDHGGMPMPSHDGADHSAPPGAEHCPFAAPGQAGCALAPLLAPAAVSTDAPASPAPRVAARADAAPDLLLASRLFHPPQR